MLSTEQVAKFKQEVRAKVANADRNWERDNTQYDLGRAGAYRVVLDMIADLEKEAEDHD